MSLKRKTGPESEVYARTVDRGLTAHSHIRTEKEMNHQI